MATINGIGTLRYDWRSRPDGTADATLWFVVLLFPIIPLRRDHLKVLSTGIKQTGVFELLWAFCGHAEGYQSEIQLLGRSPLSPWGVIRTYFNGYVVAPFIAYIGPALIFGAILFGLFKMGVDIRKEIQWLAIVFAIPTFLWAICFIAWILDRCAGRFHVYPGANTESESNSAENNSAGQLATGRISKGKSQQI